MADEVDKADPAKGTQERTDPATAKPAAKKAPAAKRTQSKAKAAKKTTAKKAATTSSKVPDEGGTGPGGRILPVDKSGLHSISQDALNPAFAPVKD